MAYITGSEAFALNNSTTKVITIPPSVTGDVVFLFIGCLSTSPISTIVGDNAGTWNLEVDASSASQDAFVYSCVQAATPDTTVTVTFISNEYVVFSVLNAKGVDTTTPIEVYAINDGVIGRDVLMPSITTTSNNSIIWRTCNNNTYPTYCAEGITDLGKIEALSNQMMLCSGSETQVTAGATGTQVWHNLNIYGGGDRVATRITMAIKDDGSGNIEPGLDLSITPYSYLLPLSRYDGGFVKGAFYDPTSVSFENISSLSNGSYTNSDLFVQEAAFDNGPLKLGFRSVRPYVTSNSFLDHVSMVGYPITETYDTNDNYNLSGALICISNKSSDGRVHPDSDIGSCLALSDQTNARFWQLGTSNSLPSLIDGVYPTVIDVDDSNFFMDEIGTPNMSDIGAVIIGEEPTATFVSVWFGSLFKLGTLALIGGSSVVKASFSSYNKHVISNMLNTVLAQGGLAQGQFFICQDTKSGGSEVVYWDCSNQSAEWPSAYNSDTKKRNFKMGAGRLTHTISGVSGSTVIYDSTTLNFGNLHNLIWDSGVAVSSVGLIVLNSNVTIVDNGSAAIGGASFIGCNEIALGGYDMSGGVSISNCIQTNAIVPLNGATQAALQLLLDDIANCTFTNNNVAVRIEFTGAAADITLNFNAITNSGNTVDIHYNSTNASTLTANMQNGSNASTSAISGAAVAVNIVNDITATFAITPTGAELTVLVDGTTTELFHVETAGTSENYVYTYSSDFDGDIQVFKQGFKPFWLAANTFSNTDQTITINLKQEPASQI